MHVFLKSGMKVVGIGNDSTAIANKTTKNPPVIGNSEIYTLHIVALFETIIFSASILLPVYSSQLKPIDFVDSLVVFCIWYEYYKIYNIDPSLYSVKTIVLNFFGYQCSITQPGILFLSKQNNCCYGRSRS